MDPGTIEDGAMRRQTEARTGRLWRSLGLGALALSSIAGCAAPASSRQAPSASASTRPPESPVRVEFPSGSLRLHGLLWKPAGHGPFPAVLFSHGSGGATADVTAGMPITEAAARLAPLFTSRGYAFFHPFRRGQGPSAGVAPFMRDRLASEEQAHGRAARQQLQDTLMQTEQLDDVLAALTFLKSVPEIDASRLALAGNSFGGQLTLLAAARDDTVRAAVTFAAAAGSWPRSEEVRRVLREAVRRARCPILLVQWANDFSTEASTALGSERERPGPPPVVALYPAVGSSPEDGHNGLYLAMSQWEPDVFRFLEQAVLR
jgi:dienelactone hydrolase